MPEDRKVHYSKTKKKTKQTSEMEGGQSVQLLPHSGGDMPSAVSWLGEGISAALWAIAHRCHI
jgi:hypothetical protein